MGRSFHQPGMVKENVLESDFEPLCDGTARRRSLADHHHSPSSIQSLKEVILEEWKKIDLAKCRQLVYSNARRLGAVIKNHGGHTKY